MEKTYKCVVCGNKFISTSNRGARFCSKECRNEYIRKKKAAEKTEQDEKFGNAPSDYAEKQKEQTLAMLPTIVKVPEEMMVKDKEEKTSDKISDAQSILVYMKGRIEGAAPFCQDETVADLLGKLLNGVNTLIEIVEEL